MGRYLFIVVFGLFGGVCSGQPAWRFHSDNYLGVAAGEIGEAAHVQTVNGFYKRPWFFGVGAGLDYYRFRSVPVFVSVRRDMVSFGRLGRSFVFVDGGVTLPWYKRELTPEQRQVFISSRFSAGAWGSAGVGYEWRISTHTSKALLFSAGYSMKKLTEKLTTKNYCSTGMCQLPQETYTYDYLNHTFLFLVGLRF